MEDRHCFSAPLAPLRTAYSLVQASQLQGIAALSTAGPDDELFSRPQQPRRNSHDTASALEAARAQEVLNVWRGAAPGGVFAAEQPVTYGAWHLAPAGHDHQSHDYSMPSFAELLHAGHEPGDDGWYSMEAACPGHQADHALWEAWDLPMQREPERTCTSVTSSSQPPTSSTSPSSSISNPDIRLVWPVCLPLGTGLRANARMSVFVDSRDDLAEAEQRRPQFVVSGLGAKQQASPGSAKPAHPTSAVLVMAGTSMEVLTRSPVEAGAAVCSVPTNRAFSVSGGVLHSQLSASSVGQPMRMLTLFATTAATAGLAAGGWETGPAVSVLCAAPRVADELNRLFCRIAADLLTLETDPSLAHAQIRDINGFVYMPGSGTATAAASGARSPCEPCTPHAGFSVGSPATAQLQARLLEGLSASHAALDAQHLGVRATVPGDVQLTDQEMHVCRHAWAKHFQPLMQQVAYLLTCVPSAFAGQLDGCPVWDQHTYCKTLAGMVAYLEHYRCWSTLAGLLQHASAIGVAFRFQGCTVSRECMSAAMLEQLLHRALHDDISIQYVPPELPEQTLGGTPVPDAAALALAMSSVWRTSRRSACTAYSADDGTRTPTACFESVDGALQMDTDAFQLEDVLAEEFKDWEQRWLARGYSGTLIASMPGSPAQAEQPGEQVAGPPLPLPQSWAAALPWEVIALLLSCAAIAVQYGRQVWGAV